MVRANLHTAHSQNKYTDGAWPEQIHTRRMIRANTHTAHDQSKYTHSTWLEQIYTLCMVGANTQKVHGQSKYIHIAHGQSKYTYSSWTQAETKRHTAPPQQDPGHTRHASMQQSRAGDHTAHFTSPDLPQTSQRPQLNSSCCLRKAASLYGTQIMMLHSSK